MKYKAKQLSNGKWAVWTGQSYFVNTVTLVEKDARVEALYMSGHWHLDKLLEIQTKLAECGVIDDRDPYGWRA